METSLIFLEHDFTAALVQVFEVGFDFTVDRVFCTDKGKCRRQVFIIIISGRCHGCRYDMHTVLVYRPGMIVLVSIPDRHFIELVGGSSSVIQHRIQRHCKSNIDILVVSCRKCKCAGDAAACSFTADEELILTDAKFCSVFLHPQQGIIAIFQSCRIRLLLSVIRQDHNCLVCAAQ